MQYFLLFLFFVSVLNKIANANLKVSPVSLKSCDDAEKLINLEYKENGDGKKAWFGNFTFSAPVDAKTDFIWEMRWWKDGAWEKNANVFKGKACFYLEKFAGKTWTEVREAANPKIESSCPIKAGSYSFDNFVTDYSGVHLPMMKKGRWSGKITINKDGKVMCAFLIVDMI